MITTGFLLLLYGLIVLVLAPITLLPDVSLPSTITTAIAAVGTYLKTIWYIAPLFVGALLVVLGIVVVVDTAIFTYKVIMWIIRKIPGIG